MCFILLASTTASAPRYLGVFLAVQFIFCLSLLLAWVANMHATESKRGGGYIVLGRSSDNVVWYLGVSNNLSKPREDFTKNHDRTNLFPADEKPYYSQRHMDLLRLLPGGGDGLLHRTVAVAEP